MKYRNGKNKSEIPFYLTVLKGGVTYDPLTTTYFINDKAADLKPREFEVRNDFECPLYVNDIIFPQDSNHYFKASIFLFIRNIFFSGQVSQCHTTCLDKA